MTAAAMITGPTISPGIHTVVTQARCRSVPKEIPIGARPLLSRVAHTVDELGDVSIEDMTFTSSVTDGEDDLTITVHYRTEPHRR